MGESEENSLYFTEKMNSSSVKPPRTLYQVWKGLPEGTLCQVINNSLVISPLPLDIHQVVLNKINFSISTLLRKQPVGEVRIAPYDVHFSRQNIFQPDLIFLANEHLKLVKARGLFGAPDLVVEVLSPGTASKDSGEKKAVYEQYGVKELFIVEPESKLVKAFLLQNNQYNHPVITTGFFKSYLLKNTIRF